VSRTVSRVVNMAAFAVALSACGSDSKPSTEATAAPPVGATVHSHYTSAGAWPEGQIYTDGVYQAVGVHRRTAADTPRAWTFEPSQVSGLFPDATGATFKRSGINPVADAIAALPPERQLLGISGLTTTQMYGPEQEGGVCEDIMINLEIPTEDGMWEADFRASGGMIFAGSPERISYALPQDCVDALLNGEACSLDDQWSHFPEGSDCEVCLNVDGDHARCVSEGECPTEAYRRVRGYSQRHGQQISYTALSVPTLFCAPDIIREAILLSYGFDDDDPLPDPFAHYAYEGLCVEQWNEAQGKPTLYCSQSIAGGATIVDMVVAEVDDLGPASAEGKQYNHRLAFLSSIEVEGITFTGSYLHENTLGPVSQPWGENYGWNLPPMELRPDGDDINDINDTFARGWVAGVAMKIASNRNLVPVVPFNANRCNEGGWVSLDDGRSYCSDVGDWIENGFGSDGWLSWWDQDKNQMMAFPWVTLASTGLPDSNIPGGFLPHIAGSTTLADPEWNECAWPDQFKPDLMRVYDAIEEQGRAPYASFDGQTVRFDSPDHDYRLAIATSQTRDFCFEVP